MATSQPINRGLRGDLARNQVYEVLREQIVSLRLLPGERVSDAAIATSLGVSRTPVREAVLQLEDEGLLRVVPQLGTFVARISVAAVHDAQFVREALETAALARAMGNVTEHDADRLTANIAEQRRAEAAGDNERFYRLDQEFHRLIMELSGHPRAWRITQRIRADMDRVRRLSLPEPAVLSHLIDQHEVIAVGLIDGDREKSEAMLRDHVRLVAVTLPRLMARYPDYFEESSGPDAP
ncbi:GntR family transcriptional regulator [Actinophytocola oryzae]|uniref:GntR family transcriptional regulator n=1 Tax=Actinophytocola oryzae TaxID=502181 RepID=A0A4R7US39_9PSEU|nr:GntR family transcriptional regulator [Actinophytocola oryzae]TDV38573.1 GntR family transcriptional regulator [Actinophytocola oryzae]